MKNRKMAALAGLGVLLLTIPAADSVAQATGAQEVWRLSAIAGETLPVLVETDSNGCREEVLEGTLTLQDDGRWILATRERETCGERIEEDTENEDGRYTVEGTTVRFLDDDGNAETEDDEDGGAEIEVDDLSVGTRSADALTIRLQDGSTTLVFRR